MIRNGAYSAHGVKNIHDTLKEINEKAREPEVSVNENTSFPCVIFVDFGSSDLFFNFEQNTEIRNSKYHLKAKFPFPLEVPTGWMVYFIDNPGFDEFSTEVSEVAMNGLGISSAVLYITTYDQYRQVQTTGFFQNMYQKNRGMHML